MSKKQNDSWAWVIFVVFLLSIFIGTSLILESIENRERNYYIAYDFEDYFGNTGSGYAEITLHRSIKRMEDIDYISEMIAEEVPKNKTVIVSNWVKIKK